VTWANDARKIIKLAFGLLIALSGGFFLWLEMKDGAASAHTGHVYAFAAWIAIGCIIIAPSVIGSAIKTLLGFLPSVKFGGDK
jgi:hypothetical protein